MQLLIDMKSAPSSSSDKSMFWSFCHPSWRRRRPPLMLLRAQRASLAAVAAAVFVVASVAVFLTYAVVADPPSPDDGGSAALVERVIPARRPGSDDECRPCDCDDGSGGLWAGHLLRSGRIVDNRDGRVQAGYNLTNPETDDYSEHRQSTALVEIFQHKRNGKYFEVGGFDGEFYSNSLKLEKELGWTGILVEPVPEFFQQMLKKGRRAAMLNACVSSKPWFDVIRIKAPKKGSMHQKSTSAGEGTLHVGGEELVSIPVECYPLIDILLACNSTTLDALFVDVQGPEYDILSNVPWERVDIQLIMAEISSMNKDPGAIERKMLDLLQPKGYKLIRQMGRDFIYMK